MMDAFNKGKTEGANEEEFGKFLKFTYDHSTPLTQEIQKLKRGSKRKFNQIQQSGPNTMQKPGFTREQ